MFAVRSLREDRCEGKNSKAFTHSALIANDLRRVGEGVKAKKENRLRRAYVRARRADSVKALVSDDRRARSGGGERESRPFVRVCSRVLHKAFALPGTLPSGHHGVRFPFLFGALRCGIDCGGAGGLSTLPRRLLRIQPIHRRATTVTRAKQSMLREVMPNISFISRPGGRLSK